MYLARVLLPGFILIFVMGTVLSNEVSGVPIQDLHERTIRSLEGYGDWKELPDFAEAASQLASGRMGVDFETPGLADIRLMVDEVEDINETLRSELRASDILERKMAVLMVLGCRGRRSLPVSGDIVTIVNDRQLPMGARVWAVVSLTLIQVNDQATKKAVVDFYFELMEAADRRPPSLEPIGVAEPNEVEFSWADTVLRCASAMNNISREEFDELAIELINRPKRVCFDYDLLQHSTEAFALDQLKLALESDHLYESDPQMLARWTRQNSAVVSIARMPRRYDSMVTSLAETVSRLSAFIQNEDPRSDNAALDIVLCCVALSALQEGDMYVRDLLSQSLSHVANSSPRPDSWQEAANVALRLVNSDSRTGERNKKPDSGNGAPDIGELPGGYLKQLFLILAYRTRTSPPEPSFHILDDNFPLHQWLHANSITEGSNIFVNVAVAHPECFSYDFLSPSLLQKARNEIEGLNDAQLTGFLDAYAHFLEGNDRTSRSGTRVLNLSCSYDPIFYSDNLVPPVSGLSKDWRSVVQGVLAENQTLVEKLIAGSVDSAQRYRRMLLARESSAPLSSDFQQKLKTYAAGGPVRTQILALRLLSKSRCPIDFDLCHNLEQAEDVELRLALYDWLRQACPGSQEAVTIVNRVAGSIPHFPKSALSDFRQVEYSEVNPHPVHIGRWKFIDIE